LDLDWNVDLNEDVNSGQLMRPGSYGGTPQTEVCAT
jgi:hypothetical protein